MQYKFSTGYKKYSCPPFTDKKQRERTAMMKSIMTGVGIGMAVGGATAYLKSAMAGSMMRRSAKKTARKAMKSMESIMGDVKYIFR
jgi:hypothetical protein